MFLFTSIIYTFTYRKLSIYRLYPILNIIWNEVSNYISPVQTKFKNVYYFLICYNNFDTIIFYIKGGFKFE